MAISGPSRTGADHDRIADRFIQSIAARLSRKGVFACGRIAGGYAGRKNVAGFGPLAVGRTG
jgi:hypothetical protein